MNRHTRISMQFSIAKTSRLPLGYVEHGRWRWFGQFASIDRPQPAEYAEERALAATIGTCDQQMHTRLDLQWEGSPKIFQCWMCAGKSV